MTTTQPIFLFFGQVGPTAALPALLKIRLQLNRMDGLAGPGRESRVSPEGFRWDCNHDWASFIPNRRKLRSSLTYE